MGENGERGLYPSAPVIRIAIKQPSTSDYLVPACLFGSVPALIGPVYEVFAGFTFAIGSHAKGKRECSQALTGVLLFQDEAHVVSQFHGSIIGCVGQQDSKLFTTYSGDQILALDGVRVRRRYCRESSMVSLYRMA